MPDPYVPPPYPRTPRLDADDADDLAVDPHERMNWLRRPCRVEEKIDGANVRIWRAGLTFDVATRGGPDAMDRAGQLGRLRAWVADRHDALDRLLVGDRALYGEWLWLTHSVAYDRLPDLLVVLDLWAPESGFIGATERDRCCANTGFSVPPHLDQGPVGDVARLEGLTRRSAYRDGPAEGVILRVDHPDGRFDRCKWVRPGFAQLSDDAWAHARPTNEVSVPGLDA